MKQVIVKPKKEAAIKRFHPWIFSGALLPLDEPIEDGEIVEVKTKSGEHLATGHFQDGSIMVRVFSFEPTKADAAFWRQKINDAVSVRRRLGLLNNPSTNCYRLVHAEGDGMPGLIIDIYGKTAVIQCHSIGMHQIRNYLAKALQEVYGDQLEAIYDKSAETLPRNYAQQVENGYLFGESTGAIVKEYDHLFHIDWAKGQKTGFFLDQRENRKLLQRFVSNKKVLNSFAYSGGFSIYALKAGAKKVDSVDVSAKAMELTDRNVELNGFTPKQHRSYTADVLDFLKNTREKYDVMVVDPPAFAKSLKKRHNAVQGYKRLNVMALEKIKPGGIMFTFSCSQVVDQPLFYNTIVAAALEVRRQVRVIHQVTQPADHPINFFHPEGSYLKGLVLYVS